MLLKLKAVEIIITVIEDAKTSEEEKEDGDKVVEILMGMVESSKDLVEVTFPKIVKMVITIIILEEENKLDIKIKIAIKKEKKAFVTNVV